MANIFKNSSKKGQLTWQELYLSPTAVTSMIQNIHVANNSVGTVKISIRWVDFSSGATIMLAKDFEIPKGSSLNALDKAIILEPDDKIEVICSVADGADFTVACLQIS